MRWRGSINGYVLNGMEINGSVPFLFPAAGLPIKSSVKPEDRSMLVAAENRNMIVLRRTDEDANI